MTNFVVANAGNHAMARLIKILKLPPNVTDMRIYFEPNTLVTMHLTTFLTEEEVNAIADWYETENLDFIPTGTTTYNLAQKQPPSA